jgi:hypothetical protein
MEQQSLYVVLIHCNTVDEKWEKITKLEVPSGISRWMSYMKEYVVVYVTVIDGQVSGFTVVYFIVIAVVKLTKNVILWKIYICLWQESAIVMFLWLRTACNDWKMCFDAA